jgi:hypothetical protein
MLCLSRVASVSFLSTHDWLVPRQEGASAPVHLLVFFLSFLAELISQRLDVMKSTRNGRNESKLVGEQVC